MTMKMSIMLAVVITGTFANSVICASFFCKNQYGFGVIWMLSTAMWVHFTIEVVSTFMGVWKA